MSVASAYMQQRKENISIDHEEKVKRGGTTGQNNSFSLKKSPENGGWQNITPLFWGIFGTKNTVLVEFLR